jgi:hypothetical protein
MGVPRLTRWLTSAVLLVSCANDGAARDVAVTSSALRPTPGSGASWSFDDGDQVEQFDSAEGFFRVHYTRAGRNAVPPADTDHDGVHDYVAEVAENFDAVLKFYAGLGYREPIRDGSLPSDNGGDDRFDVYLLDFALSADGQYVDDSACAADSCSGYMIVENDFNGRDYASVEAAIRLVASHELFHAVQRAYTADSSGVLAEGTAVWASEAFDAATGDLERQAPGYLNQPERSLGADTAGTFDAFTYGSCLFFQFLDERIGRGVIRELWEGLSEDTSGDPEVWPTVLDGVLMKHDSSLAEVFRDFSTWNWYTGGRADPERAYAHGGDYPEINETRVEPGFHERSVRVFPLAARYYALTAHRDATLMAAAPLTGDDAGSGPGLALTLALERDGRIIDVVHGSNDGAQLEVKTGDVFHVVVLNMRDQGESLRPALCIGSESGLAACRETPTTSNAPAANGGGGCDALGTCPGPASHGLSFSLALASAWLARRRRFC